MTNVLKRVVVGVGVYFFFGAVFTYTVGISTLGIVICLVLAVWGAVNVEI